MSHSSGSSKYTICLTTATIYYRYRKVWREWPARSPHAFISTYAHKPWKCNCASLNIVKPSKSTQHLWVLDPRAGGQPLRCLYPELGRRGRWVQICFHPWHVVTSPPGIHEHLPPPLPVPPSACTTAGERSRKAEWSPLLGATADRTMSSRARDCRRLLLLPWSYLDSVRVHPWTNLYIYVVPVPLLWSCRDKDSQGTAITPG